MRLNNGQSSSALRWGPGGVSNRPELNRWMKVINSSGLDIFLPDNSGAERNAVFNNLPGNVSGVTVRKGQYGVGSVLYNNTARIGTGPCWQPNSNPASYQNPAGCPSGFTAGGGGGDSGFADVNSTNTITFNGQAGIPHNNATWMAWYALGYGCPSGFVAKWRVRYCSV